MPNRFRKDIDYVTELLLEAMDRLEELAEDNEQHAPALQKITDRLSAVCDELEDING